jgi:hypothetical protein
MIPLVVKFPGFYIERHLEIIAGIGSVQQGNFVIEKGKANLPGKLVLGFNNKFLLFPGISRPGNT